MDDLREMATVPLETELERADVGFVMSKVARQSTSGTERWHTKRSRGTEGCWEKRKAQTNARAYLGMCGGTTLESKFVREPKQCLETTAEIASFWCYHDPPFR